MGRNKWHIFNYKGSIIGAFTLCGIPDGDGIVFGSGRDITCKKCLKKLKKKR